MEIGIRGRKQRGVDDECWSLILGDVDTPPGWSPRGHAGKTECNVSAALSVLGTERAEISGEGDGWQTG